MPALPRQSGKLDINIEHGIDYDLVAIYKIDGVAQSIAGYSASFVLKKHKGSSTSLLSLTKGDGITFVDSEGKVLVRITDTQSVFGSRKMYYSLKIISPSGDDIQLLRGICQSYSVGE